jgi:hypothetical protein
MFFNRKPSHTAPVQDLANLKITDARVGDMLSISGAAADFSDLDFTIDRLEGYEAGNRRWVELSGMWRDRRVYLEVHNEENTTVLGNFDGRQITLDELGLSEEDLAQMDQRQNPADFFDYDGKFWLFRSSREIGVFRAGETAGRGFYSWQFQEQDAKRFISIRKSQSEPFTASLWVNVEPADITVFRST